MKIVSNTGTLSTGKEILGSSLTPFLRSTITRPNEVGYLFPPTDFTAHERHEIADFMVSAWIQWSMVLSSEEADEPMEAFAMNGRAWNALCRAGIQSVGQLAEKTASDLLRLRGMGRASLKTITEGLLERGLHLRDPVRPPAPPTSTAATPPECPPPPSREP
jgi:Bacterial RNA polymerase, alpha chain C terminal domain